MYKVLADIPEEKKENISVAELLYEMGKRVPDPKSILAVATRKEMPCLCRLYHGISSMGLQPRPKDWNRSSSRCDRLTEEVFEA